MRRNQKTISFRLALPGMLNLDTHILIKGFDENLTPHERNVLTGNAEWSISAIVMWEITKLSFDVMIEAESIQLYADAPFVSHVVPQRPISSPYDGLVLCPNCLLVSSCSGPLVRFRSRE